jgi:hypothetical protein
MEKYQLGVRVASLVVEAKSLGTSDAVAEGHLPAMLFIHGKLCSLGEGVELSV